MTPLVLGTPHFREGQTESPLGLWGSGDGPRAAGIFCVRVAPGFRV